MPPAIDLPAYLARIRYDGSVRPDYDTLAGLLAAHMARIPFENLDVLLGRTIRLDLPGLEDKLVRSRRGGYCFEHATLFAAALEAIGFAPVRHSARVLVAAPRTHAPRTHMFLTVPLVEGTFVVDPGFGVLAPRLPVPLALGAYVRGGDEQHAMVRDGPHWILRAHADDKVLDAWVSTLEADNAADFSMANHYTSTFSGSPFVSRLMLRALTPEGRVTVMNRDVTVRMGGETRTTQLEDRAALRELLNRDFGFDLPEAEGLRVPMIPEWS